jgi:poly(3-hydroxybutyrate) depolymerase
MKTGAATVAPFNTLKQCGAKDTTTPATTKNTKTIFSNALTTITNNSTISNMKIGQIEHITHNHGEPLAKPYYTLLVELKATESWQRAMFPNQKFIPHRKHFNTREEAEQYAKQNLKQ